MLWREHGVPPRVYGQGEHGGVVGGKPGQRPPSGGPAGGEPEGRGRGRGKGMAERGYARAAERENIFIIKKGKILLIFFNYKKGKKILIVKKGKIFNKKKETHFNYKKNSVSNMPRTRYLIPP